MKKQSIIQISRPEMPSCCIYGMMQPTPAEPVPFLENGLTFLKAEETMPIKPRSTHPQLHLLSTPTKAHMITFCSVLEPDWIPIVLLQHAWKVRSAPCAILNQQQIMSLVSPLQIQGKRDIILFLQRCPGLFKATWSQGRRQRCSVPFPIFLCITMPITAAPNLEYIS